MIRVLIITEGSGFGSKVRKIISERCPHLEVASHSHDVKSGVSAIIEHDPDLIFLETNLSDGSGFDLLRHFDKPDFKTIFLSFSAEYAVKAFKFNAVGYLLKPINHEELALAVNKASEMIRFEETLHQKALGESFSSMNKTPKMVLKASDQVHVINIPEIIRIEADHNYSTFHMYNGKHILVTKPLKEYEGPLLDHGFHRIHKSHIFNMNHMSHLDKVDGGFIVMCDGSRIPVASRKREMLVELFEKYN